MEADLTVSCSLFEFASPCMYIVVLVRHIYVGLLGLGELSVPRGTVLYIRTHFLYLFTHWNHFDLYHHE
jgi:hypothetical protein